MEATDSKRRYKAVGNKIFCNQHDGVLVMGTDKDAKGIANRMNKAIIAYYKIK
jgi:translation initiation factor 6 (eIF-6)